MSEYQKQANDFCQKFGVKFTVGEPTYKRHFADDREERWVFPVTLTRNGKSMRVQFGQSIAAGSTAPTAYDVLACLTKSDPGSLCDFVSEYGYDYEMVRPSVVRNLYKAVRSEWERVCKVFGSEGECYEALCEIC